MLYAIYKDNVILGYYATEKEATQFKHIYTTQFPNSTITIVEIYTTENE